MERIVERCAGLDVHKASVTACVRRIATGGEGEEPHQETRKFSTTTRGLLELRDWLASFELELVGMEATGVYWKPVYYILEDDFECWLLNARHLKNVPGRKTDVADAAWICQLLEHGLVRPSFVPPKEIRELRNLTRYRKRRIGERAKEVQRLEKVLREAGIKLSSVATRVLGASGRAMIEALVEGTTDPEVLAELASTTSLVAREPVEKFFFERFLADESRAEPRFSSLFDPISRNIRRRLLLIYRLSRA